MRINSDWFTLTPATRIARVGSYILIPAFSYSDISWKGVSEVVCQFNFSAEKSFVLRNVPTTPTSDQFIACIRYRVGNTVYRYKLWSGVGEVLANAPDYSGQVIKKNFVIEIWNVANVTAPANTAEISFNTSVVSIPTDFRSLTSTELATSTEVTYDDLKTTVGELYSDLNPDHHWRGAVTSDDANVDSISDIVGGVSFELGSGAVAPTYSSGDSDTNNKPFSRLIAGSLMEAAVSGSGIYLQMLIRQRAYGATKQILSCDGLEIIQNAGTPDINVKDVVSGNSVTVTTIPVVGSSGAFYQLAVYYAASNMLVYVYDIENDMNLLQTLTVAANTTFSLSNLVLGKDNGAGVPACALFDIADLMIWKSGTTVTATGLGPYIQSRYVESAISFPVTTNSGNAWLDNE